MILKINSTRGHTGSLLVVTNYILAEIYKLSVTVRLHSNHWEDNNDGNMEKKLVQLMIWPIMSYGSETWIYLKSVQNMINVFERWCYRRMLRISWTEHVTNEEVFNRANTKPTLLDELLKRRLAFHGHLVRKGGITLDLMIGRLHGTRPRGRPRTTWLKDLTTHANISYKESMTIPRDRKKWRSVGNPRRTPDE